MSSFAVALGCSRNAPAQQQVQQHISLPHRTITNVSSPAASIIDRRDVPQAGVFHHLKYVSFRRVPWPDASQVSTSHSIVFTWQLRTTGAILKQHVPDLAFEFVREQIRGNVPSCIYRCGSGVCRKHAHLHNDGHFSDTVCSCLVRNVSVAQPPFNIIPNSWDPP